MRYDHWNHGESRRRKLSADAGQSLLEMAMVLPVLLGLVIGIFEFGLAWNRQQVLTNAAREGARVGVLPGTDDADVVGAIDGYLLAAGLSVCHACLTITNSEGDTGDIVAVQIAYPHEFRFLGPVMSLMSPGESGPGTVTLQTFVNMRHE